MFATVCVYVVAIVPYDVHTSCLSPLDWSSIHTLATYVQSKEDLQRNQSHGNSTCVKRIQLHLHNLCTCESYCEVMFTYSAVRNKRPNSLQTCGTKLSGHSIQNTEKTFSKVMPDGRMM